MSANKSIDTYLLHFSKYVDNMLWNRGHIFYTFTFTTKMSGKNRIKRFVFRFLSQDLINMPENTIKKIISDNISTALHALFEDNHLLEIIGTYLTVGLRANMAQQWKGQTFFISHNKRYKKTKP